MHRLCATGSDRAADPAANDWVRLDKADLTGRRWDVPLGYDPVARKFLILGGRTTFADYKKPRSYDILALDETAGTWENLFPPGQDWGPKVGPCQAPGLDG